MEDLRGQIAFVVSATERVLRLIDQDPLSPTHGCAHLAYWRDKTSELADMRRQEVMLALALLFRNSYPGSAYQGDPRLKKAVEALLSFWCRNRYPDGSLDEWYKGERAFAAAAFGVFAVARTLEVMAGEMDGRVAELGRAALAQTAAWLVGRDDLFKTNHQAVGVCALAWAARVLGDPALERNARDKLAMILAAQTEEGWFPEVGHMDSGYTFLTVEYLAMVMDLWGDWSQASVLAKALDFVGGLLHPDLTLGDEYGICHNPYVSSIAVALCSGFSPVAAWLRQSLAAKARGFGGWASTLADDLRLLRNAWQPLLAHDYWVRTAGAPLADPSPPPLCDGAADLGLLPLSGLARFATGGGTGLLVGTAGGLLRLFSTPEGQAFSDHGYAIDLGGAYATNMTYDPGLKVVAQDGRLRVACPIAPVSKMMPSFAARLGLRLACSTAWGSRLARRLIDHVRQKKGTALNQSSSNLKADDSPWHLSRSLTLAGETLVLEDVLSLRRPVRAEDLRFLLARPGQPLTLTPARELLPGLGGELGEFRLRKRFVNRQSWQLQDLEVL